MGSVVAPEPMKLSLSLCSSVVLALKGLLHGWWRSIWLCDNQCGWRLFGQKYMVVCFPLYRSLAGEVEPWRRRDVETWETWGTLRKKGTQNHKKRPVMWWTSRDSEGRQGDPSTLLNGPGYPVAWPDQHLGEGSQQRVDVNAGDPVSPSSHFLRADRRRGQGGVDRHCPASEFVFVKTTKHGCLLAELCRTQGGVWAGVAAALWKTTIRLWRIYLATTESIGMIDKIESLHYNYFTTHRLFIQMITEVKCFVAGMY